mmetsp:Transcript_14243/g.29928  ORF Transcript_14243/g.29928 Transcript_14243/m.29928 type:complete len:899 (+) Transcript_14243:95-2791(+)|eukprot:CAMPEP_0171376330 /NCGR_PEP_ID=MMETSP0879-20121228/18411_1 /TAXON_ID=67004 /ORGANISM="Thalassiosira weissflogii, Strain CCMP1336" /LENGTH=898 /DNA_ID=CAMNT_0011886125 /DNA_START=42 /DNA_END=2738 /DNA_ORIENTATION=+
MTSLPVDEGSLDDGLDIGDEIYVPLNFQGGNMSASTIDFDGTMMATSMRVGVPRRRIAESGRRIGASANDSLRQINGTQLRNYGSGPAAAGHRFGRASAPSASALDAFQSLFQPQFPTIPPSCGSIACKSSACGASCTSECPSVGTFQMHHVDISKNHGHGTVPVPGRESHTADLEEFDRYVRLMQAHRRGDEWLAEGGCDDGQCDFLRNEMESPKKLRNGDIDSSDPLGMNIKLGDDNSEDDNPDEYKLTITKDPIACDEKNNQFEDTKHDCTSTASSSTQKSSQLQPSYPFNAKFWAYIRSILEKAKPVGYSELPEPSSTQVKGPKDANAFLQKVIGISSINPIQPAILAENGEFDEMEVMAELLYATCVGLVAMRFAPECVRCGSAVLDTDMLGRMPSRARCEGCNAPNVIDSLDKIKVMFLLNSDVLYILAENYACNPSAKSMSLTSVYATVPATATCSGFSYSVGTGKETEIAPALPPGKYRMHCPVAKTDNYLVVEKPCEETDEPCKLPMKVSELVFNHKHGTNKTILTAPHGKIQFDIFPDTKSFFVLWVQEDKDDTTLIYLPEEERVTYTSAAQIMHHPVFNSLFQEHQVVSVPKDIFLSIANVVLVFTDIVDSTKMYASLGDGDAFMLVRKHFQVLFGAFTKRGGRVIKTIGDAVMASFTTGKAALHAVADAMEMLPTAGIRPDSNRFLEIRVGIHCGRVAVVPLNGVNDYFGQTTNIAARVQSQAKASECFVTEAVLDSSRDARDAYTEITSSGSAFQSTPVTQLNLKGVQGNVKARGFLWARRARRESELSCSSGSFIERKGHREGIRVDSNALRSSIKSLNDITDVPKRAFQRPAELGRRRSSNLLVPDDDNLSSSSGEDDTEGKNSSTDPIFDRFCNSAKEGLSD